jgi:hypothetical protein
LCSASAAFGQNAGVRLVSGTALYDVPNNGTSGTIPTSEPSGTLGTSTGSLRLAGASSADYIYHNWWWFRVNAPTLTREGMVYQPPSAGTAVRSYNGADSVSYTLTTTPQLTFTLTFTLTQLSPTTSVVHTWCTALNTGTSDLDVSLFNLADVDVNGSTGVDAFPAAPYSPGAGIHGDRIVNYAENAATGQGASHWGYGADSYTIGSSSSVAFQLTGPGPGIDTPDHIGASLQGDIADYIRWDVGVLHAGDSRTVHAAIIAWNAAPAPSTFCGLLLLPLVAQRKHR